MQELRKHTVVLEGLGALGLPVGRFLTQAGIGRLYAFDPDVVEAVNCIQGYPVQTIGQPKVEAFAYVLRQIRPDLVVEGRQSCLRMVHWPKIIVPRHNIVRGMLYDRFDVAASEMRAFCMSWTFVHAHMRDTGIGVVAASQPGRTCCVPCCTDIMDLEQGHGRDGDLLAMSLVALVAAKMMIALTLRNTPAFDRYKHYVKEPICHAIVTHEHRAGARLGRTDIPLYCQFVRPDWDNLPSCRFCRSYLSHAKGEKT